MEPILLARGYHSRGTGCRVKTMSPHPHPLQALLAVSLERDTLDQLNPIGGDTAEGAMPCIIL